MADWPPPDDGEKPPLVTKGYVIDVFKFEQVTVQISRDHGAEPSRVFITCGEPSGSFAMSIDIKPEQAVALAKALKEIGS